MKNFKTKFFLFFTVILVLGFFSFSLVQAESEAKPQETKQASVYSKEEKFSFFSGLDKSANFENNEVVENLNISKESKSFDLKGLVAPQSTKFTVGDKIKTVANGSTATGLAVRDTPNGVLVGRPNWGATGTVVDSGSTGLANPTYNSGYYWWYISYDNGTTGWSAEDWVEVDTTAVAFNAGDRVQVIDDDPGGLWVFADGPCLGDNVVVSQGEIGTVQDNSNNGILKECYSVNKYDWFLVTFDSGESGWVAHKDQTTGEKYIDLYSPLSRDTTFNVGDEVKVTTDSPLGLLVSDSPCADSFNLDKKVLKNDLGVVKSHADNGIVKKCGVEMSKTGEISTSQDDDSLNFYNSWYYVEFYKLDSEGKKISGWVKYQNKGTLFKYIDLYI